MPKIDSISVTVPPKHTFECVFAGETSTETRQLPPYATVRRGPAAWHTYWNVTRSSMRRLFRAMEFLAKEAYATA